MTEILARGKKKGGLAATLSGTLSPASAARVADRGGTQDPDERVEEVDPGVPRARVAAAHRRALEPAVDRLDRASEAHVAVDAAMRRLVVAAGLGHPVPERALHRRRGIVERVGVVDQLDAEVALGRAVV